jgi:membrane protein YqaA with SNARE-associated domain
VLFAAVRMPGGSEDMSIVEQIKQSRWFLATIYAIVIIGMSVGLYFLVGYLKARFDISGEGLATTAYLVVFITSLVSNATVIVPVPIFVGIMIPVADMMAEVSPWGPVLVALTASSAGTLGEITGYYAGYLGKKIIVTETTPGYEKLVAWMRRHGPLAIFLVSLQPILPFDIAGLVSGASRIPIWKFLLPCWAGKSLKYTLGCYLGGAFLSILPPLPF